MNKSMHLRTLGSLFQQKKACRYNALQNLIPTFLDNHMIATTFQINNGCNDPFVVSSNSFLIEFGDFKVGDCFW
jgi:hypothetical protein